MSDFESTEYSEKIWFLKNGLRNSPHQFLFFYPKESDEIQNPYLRFTHGRLKIRPDMSHFSAIFLQADPLIRSS